MLGWVTFYYFSIKLQTNHMKKIILLFAFTSIIACEKATDEKQTLTEPPVKVEQCDCYVWESKTVTKYINGRIVSVFQWEKGRYFSNDCEDDRLSFDENGNPAEVRCTSK